MIFNITFFLLIHVMLSQFQLSGIVFDRSKNEPLAGVQIQVKNRLVGTVTDKNGSFVLKDSQRIDEIIVSYVGYKSQSLKVSSTDIKIYLVESRYDADEIVVSANRVESKREDQALAISKLSDEEIEHLKPQMLHEVLNKIPGVLMDNIGNEQHAMAIRQPMSYKAYFLYLEDGIPIRPMGIFNHNALIEMNMYGLEAIEVIKGPSSSIYGPEAIGGAVNFLSKKPSFHDEMKYGIQYDDNGNKQLRFHQNYSVNETIGVTANGYYTNQSDGFIDYSDYKKFSGNLRTDYYLNDHEKLRFIASYNYLNTNTGSGNVRINDFVNKIYKTLHTFTEREVFSFRTNLSYEYNWSESNKTAATFFYRNNEIAQIPSYRIRDDYKPGKGGDKTKASGEVNSNKFYSLGGLLQQSIAFDDFNINLGIYRDFSPNDYIAESIDIKQDELTRQYLSYQKTGKVKVQYNADILNTAYYGQFEYKGIKNINFTAGLRYDLLSFKHHDDLGQKDNANVSYDHLSPKLGATYQINELNGLYLNYSKGFYAPGLSELFRSRENNHDLKPAYFNNYEIGFWLKPGNDLGIDISLYRMDGIDEVLVFRDENDVYRNVNAGETRHEGIELGLNYRINESLLLSFASSYSRHHFINYKNAGVDFSGNEQSRAPRWVSDFEINYQPHYIKNLNIALQWIYRSKFWMDDANTLRYEAKTLFNLSGNSYANLRFMYTIDDIYLVLKVNNLTDEYFANSASKTRWSTSYRVANPRVISISADYRFDL